MLEMKEILKMEDNVLSSKVKDLRKEMFDFRMKSKTSTVEKPHRYAEIRREIARISTVMQQRKQDGSK